MTKEQLEKLFGVSFLDYEVEIFNMVIEAHRKGEKVIVYPARQSTHKVMDCINIYEALQSGIKVNQVFYDEYIGGTYDRR